MERVFWLLSGINGFLAVALGAFGAHGLRGRLSGAPDGARRLEVWETAAQYHFMHALALGLAAYLCSRSSLGSATATGYLFQAGIVIFSGSLYLLAITGVTKLGMITPIGGLCFLAGWCALIWTAAKL